MFSLPHGVFAFAFFAGLAGSLAAPPAQFKNAPPSAAGPPSATLASPAWWHLFHDATLDRLETQALAANQDLAESVSRIEIARQQTRGAAADFYPHLAINSSAERLRTTDTGPVLRSQLVGNAGAFFGGTGSGGVIPAFAARGLSVTYDDFRAPLSLSYELDVFGRIRHQYGSAHANLQAAEADRRAVRLSLASQVAGDYFRLRAFDSQVAVLQRTRSLRQAAIHLNDERLHAGVGAPLDLARAKVELDGTLSDLTDAARLRAETENTLANLCGQPASEFHLPAAPLEEVPPPAVPPGVPADLLAHRPDLAEAERRVDAAGEEIGVARARMLPTFSLQANAGFESADDSHVFEAQSRALSVLGSVNIPVFEGGRNLAGLREAKARRDAALAQYRSTALAAFRDVETALSDLRERVAQADARRRAIADATEVLELSQRQFLEGAVNYFDVVDAQRSLLGAELNNVNTLDSRFTATIALIQAIGGGWSASE